MAPRVVDKAARRAEITQAAVEVFARQGFQGSVLDDVARAAGVSKGSLYAYFQSKDDLFYACFQAFQDDVLKVCELAMAGEATPWDKLVRCLRQSASALEARIDLYPLTLEFWAAASTGPSRERFAHEMQAMYARFRDMTADLIAAGQQAGEFREDADPAAVAGWLVGGLDGLMLQYWFDQSLDVTGWLDGFLAVVHRGIARENV